MVGMVDVVIPVDAEAAAALSDERKREAVGRIVSRILRPQPDHDPLVEAMERLGADAQTKGLTNEAIDAELAAHKASAIVSAAMAIGGIPYQALKKARSTDVLALSQPVFDEVFDVLYRLRLARFINADLRAELLDQLVSGTLWFNPAITVTDCRDPTDNKYLELALAAQAASIVSSDQDLLAHGAGS